jgi:hypothetical protein
MKVSDPLRRGLCPALQLTITLLSTAAVVTVLHSLLHPREQYRACWAVLLPLVATALGDHRPELARGLGKEVVPGSTGSPQDAPTDGPLDAGSEG